MPDATSQFRLTGKLETGVAITSFAKWFEHSPHDEGDGPVEGRSDYQSAAQQRRKFLIMAEVTDRDIPKNLSKDGLWAELMSRDVKGPVVGKTRLALGMIIKNVWDYPEMHRRGILPKPEEKQKSTVELKQIISKAILTGRMLHKPFQVRLAT